MIERLACNLRLAKPTGAAQQPRLTPMHALASRNRLLGGRVGRLCLMAVVVAMAVSFSLPAVAKAADEGQVVPVDSATTQPPIRFRRVLVPAKRRADWSLGATRYLPVETAEFQKLLRETQVDATVDAPETTRIEKAAYEFKLDEQGVLAGEGILMVVHRHEGASLLNLGETSAAIESARWLPIAMSDGGNGPPATEKASAGNEESITGRTEASLGAAGATARLGLDGQGRLRLIVDRSARLRLRLSLRGMKVGSSFTFPLRLPTAMFSVVTLRLPPDAEPEVDGAIVESIGKTDEGDQRWKVTLGGRAAMQLRIHRTDDVQRRATLALLRTQTSYDVSLRGLDVSVRWELDVHHGGLNSLDVVAEAPLRIATARLGDQLIPWRRLDGRSSDHPAASPAPGPLSGTRYRLALPEPLKGAGHVVRIGFLAPLPDGGLDYLPRVGASNVFWQDGTATLAVSRPLEVVQLDGLGCRQSAIGQLSAPRAGESFQFQLYRSDATVALRLRPIEARPEAIVLSAVDMTAEGLAAQVLVELSATAGAIFRQEAVVGDDWVIERVTAQPAKTLDQWSVEARDDRRILMMRLGAPVSGCHPARLTIHARHVGASLGSPFALAELIPLSLKDVEEKRSAVSIRPRDGYRLLREDGAAEGSADETDWPTKFAALIQQRSEAQLFPAGRYQGRQLLRLRRQRPSHAVDVGVVSTVAPVAGSPTDKTHDVGDSASTEERKAPEGETPVSPQNGYQLTEKYRIAVIPTETPIDRVLVRFSRARPATPRWRVEGGAESLFTARRIDGHAGKDDSAHAGEQWEIKLAQPRTTRFVLEATRLTPVHGRFSPSLAIVPDAATHTASLELRAAPGAQLAIQRCRLRSLPRSVAASGVLPTLRGTFSYDPIEASPRPAGSAPLIVAIEDQPAPSAWAWRGVLESAYNTDGNASHRATYFIENTGRDHLRIALPRQIAPAAPVECWIDGQRHGLTRPGPSAGGIAVAGGVTQSRAEDYSRVELPVERRFVVLTLAYSTASSPLGYLGRISPAWPRLDTPVFEQRWSVWTPASYALTADEPATATEGSGRHSAADRSWQRLLGPLARNEHTDLTGLGLPLFARLSHAATDDANSAERNATADLPADRNALEEMGLAQHGASSEETLSGEPDRVTMGPWSKVQRAAPEAVDVAPPGWSRMTIDGEATGQRLEYYHRHVSRLLGLVAFLIVFSASWAFLRHRIVLLAWLIAPAGLVALLVPPVAAPAATGVTLGLIFCVGFRLIHRQLHGRRPADTSADSSGRTVALPPGTQLPIAGQASSATLLVFCALAILHHGAMASADSHPPGADNTRRQHGYAREVGWAERSEAVPRMVAQPIMLAQVASEDEPSGDARETEAGRNRPEPGAGTAAPTGTGASSGSSEESQPNGAPAATYRVLVPVDEERQPVGDKLYVPEAFYQRLYRHRGLRSDDVRGWLITRAVYRGGLARRSTDRLLELQRLMAEYELHVLSSPARVVLDLDESTVNLLPEGAELDGQPIQPEWVADGRGLAFQIDTPGSYRLTLAMRPQPLTGARQGFRMRLPPVPAARLELNLPAVPPRVEVPTARGNIEWREDPRGLTVHLGPISELVTYWWEGSAVSGDQPALEARQYGLLRVRPGSVLLDLKLRLDLLRNRAREISLIADSRLRLLPPEDSGVVPEIARESQQPQQRITLRWPEPLTAGREVNVRFVVADTSGLGNLRVPGIRVENARVRRNWLGISVDPGLRYTASDAGKVESVPVDEFARAWSEDAEPPRAAFRVEGDAPDWTVATQPRETITTCDDELVVRLNREAAAIRYRSRLVTAEGFSFRHRVAIPRSFEVESVSVRDAERERLGRWARADEGTLELFLDSPLNGEYELTIGGRLPLGSATCEEVPGFRVVDARRTAWAVSLWRREDVLVDVVPGSNLVERPMPVPDLTASPLLRPVGRYRADLEDDLTLSFRVSDNPASVQGKQMLRIWHDEQGWIATLDLRCRVPRGVLDQLSIAAPPGWHPVAQGASVVLEEASLNGQRRILVRPRQPIRGQWRLRLTAPLPVDSDRAWVVPRIGLADSTPEVEHYVALPQSANGAPVAWRTTGLRSVADAKLSRSFDLSDKGPLDVYRVADEDFSATLRPFSSRGEIGRVALAEVRFDLDRRGTLRGTALFDVHPGDDNFLAFSLPENYQLSHVAVEGMPRRATRQGHNRWRVPLLAGGRLLRLRVLFFRKLDDEDRVTVQAPTIERMPVERTLWSVRVDGAADLLHGDADAQTDATEYAVLRVESLGAMIRAAAEPPLDSSVKTWYSTWARRWVAASHRANRLLVANYPPNAGPLGERRRRLAARLETALEEQREQAAIVDAAGTLDTLLASDEGEPPLDPMLILDTGADELRFQTNGELPSIAFSWADEPPSVHAPRLQAGIIWVLAVAAVSLGLHRGLLGELFSRWPHALGVTVGIGWWLFLAPPWFGLLLVATSLAAAMRSLWPFLVASRRTRR